MSVTSHCFRYCYILSWLCFALVSLTAGCCSTSNNASPSGAAASKSTSTWHFFQPEPKKPQTPADFIALPRPE